MASDTSFFMLMALHVLGALLNLRMLVTCFRDKTNSTILQKCRPTMMIQFILQLAILNMNVDESFKAFSKQHRLNCCNANNVLMISAGFLMDYNLLAMLAIRYHNIVYLKYELSAEVAILATLMAGILTSGIILWVGCFILPEELCGFQIASAFASILLLLVMLWIAKRIFTFIYHIRANPWTRDSPLFNFVTILFLLCFVSIIILEVVRHGSAHCFNLIASQISDSFERIFFLYVLCVAVGVALPVMFQQLTSDSSVDWYTDKLQRILTG